MESPIKRKIEALPVLKEGFIAKSIHHKELQNLTHKTTQMYHRPYQMDIQIAREKMKKEEEKMDGMSMCERCELITKCKEQDKDIDNVLYCPRFIRKEKANDTGHKKNS